MFVRFLGYGAEEYVLGHGRGMSWHCDHHRHVYIRAILLRHAMILSFVFSTAPFTAIPRPAILSPSLAVSSASHACHFCFSVLIALYGSPHMTFGLGSRTFAGPRPNRIAKGESLFGWRVVPCGREQKGVVLSGFEGENALLGKYADGRLVKSGNVKCCCLSSNLITSHAISNTGCPPRKRITLLSQIISIIHIFPIASQPTHH
jgi:hypothetical protein